MQDPQRLATILEQYGEQLLRPNLRRYGQPGKDQRKGCPAPLSGQEIRAGLRAIVRGTPEVMVKVTGGGRGMGAIKAHMSYISRHGELTLENQDGFFLKGKEDLNLLADEWRYGGAFIPEVSHRREAFHVMFSMPPGADAQAVYNAARAFAREEFARHKYALVLHEPTNDPDSHRPHVHLIVRAQSWDTRRLNPKKADLARWRQVFADRLMERGVAASATRRQTRGVVQAARKLRDYHRRPSEPRRGPARPGMAAQRTEHEVLTAWIGAAEALRQSGNQEDADLAREMIDFKERMPSLLQERQKHRQRFKEIGLESDRQEELARQKENQMGRKGPSLER